MLVMTERAVSTIRLLSDDPQTRAGTGLRIATGGSERVLEVAMVAGPKEGDQVVEYDDATVFLDEHAARLLDDKVIDADMDAGGRVNFTVSDQTAPQG